MRGKRKKKASDGTDGRRRETHAVKRTGLSPFHILLQVPTSRNRAVPSVKKVNSLASHPVD